MKTKASALCALTTLAITGTALAGPDDITYPPTRDFSLASPASGFDSAIRPITNPTLFDLAVPRTQVHAVFMHNEHPSFLSTSAGDLPVGGDFNLFAVQLEYAFTDRFSLVATKDGYIDFNPDTTLTETEGFANIAAGVKYAFILDPAKQFALSGIATVEFPTGDSEVWQGRGDGALNLSLAKLKRYERLQFASAMGLHIPFDNDAESFTGFMSAHVSYEICSWFIPLVELNWYHVFEEGDSSSNFDDQPINSVASPNFEGGDLVNFGSGTSSVGEDIVTIGLGFRTRLNDAATVGFAWETPLTDQRENLMKNRFTADLTWTF